MMGYGLVDHERNVSEGRLKTLRDLLKQQPQPDILCLQEAGPLAIKAFDSLRDYPHRHVLPPKGAVIYSKYPIVEKGFVDLGSKINSCLWADVLLPDQKTVRLYSAHLESTRLNDDSYDLLSDHTSDYRAPLAGIKDLVVKYPLYAGKRADQALIIKEHIEKSPYPVILSGDMNEPPMSYTYRVLKDGMTDAFMESGSGIGNTWKGKVPMLRIDYIFASEDLANTSYICLRSDLSDHYPVKASFTFE